MRLTNTIRDEIIEKSIDYIYGDLVKKTNDSLASEFREIIELFKTTNMYKKGVQVYKDCPNYVRPLETLQLKIQEIHYRCSCNSSSKLTVFLDKYRNIPISIIHDFSLSWKNFKEYEMEYFTLPGAPFYRALPSYEFNVENITKDENGNFVVEMFDSNKRDFEEFFKNEDPSILEKYYEIYNRMFNTFWKPVEIIYDTWKKLFDIAYSVNTTNQLFNILPNASKFLSYTSKSDGKFEVSINEELNNLLN